MKEGSQNYLVKVNGQRYETTSYRRFYNHVGTINWGNCPVYLRVSYGDGYYNDGEYTNKKEFLEALEAFIDS